MNETGVVKFRCERLDHELTEFPDIAELQAIRRKLRQRGWLGIDENGVGFGNLSVRDGNSNHFYITGSSTGCKNELDLSDYAYVSAYSFDQNRVWYAGEAVASSESLSHAAVYEARSQVRAVIHIHDLALWRKERRTLPTTADSVEYGTPAMAAELKRLLQTPLVSRVVVMGGHVGGLIAFGSSAEGAYEALTQITGDNQ